MSSLYSLARTLAGRRVCRETRSQSSSPLVSPQVKQTAQGHVPRSQTHTTGKLGEITQWFPTEIIYYIKLESSEGLWLLLYERGI